MTPAQIFARLGEVKSIIGGVLVVGGVIISALGMLKVPSQQAAIAKSLKDHETVSQSQTQQTNKKLDVLICLQAKLDTPIRCVARGDN